MTDVAWIVYRKMGAFVWLLSRLAAKDQFDRIRVATEIFRRFPVQFAGLPMEGDQRAAEHSGL